MCLLAWYDKAAQPQNMTFSQRKSWAASFLVSIFYIARVIVEKCSVKPTILKTFYHFLNFNLQSNREFLRYKGPKMNLEGVHYYCKNIKFFQNVEKKKKKQSYIVTLKVPDRNREGLDMPR